MLSVVSPENRGLVNLHPNDESTTSPGFAHGVPGFAITHGARVIDSTPPATTTSASPDRIACAAEDTAVSPDAHNRFTVYPGTESGSPANSTAIRATFRLSSPAWFAAPRITSSTTSPANPTRRSTSPTTSAARSSGRTPASAPP